MSCKPAIQEFFRAYTIPKARQSPVIAATFKAAAAKFTPQQSDNVQTFLRAAKKHKELVERYNPTASLTQEERTKKAANRVGLSTDPKPQSDSSTEA